MATYKVEVVQRLGKFHAALYEATGPKQEPSARAGHGKKADLVEDLRGLIKKAGLDDEGDSIIFRGIAYTDFDRLCHDVARGNF